MELLVEDNKISTLYWAEVDRAITAAGASFWATTRCRLVFNEANEGCKREDKSKR